ncbi:MAG: molybdopterin cofactor-binding domain-containing protein [Conexivisphaerales archaeon]
MKKRPLPLVWHLELNNPHRPFVHTDSFRCKAQGYEAMTVRILPDGRVEIFTTLSQHGQGIETTLCQVCTDLLGISLDEVEMRYGDTMSTPYGYGTLGSRSAVVGAGALHRCTEQLKAQMILVASKFLNIPIHSLVFEDGKLNHISDKSKTLSLRQLAKIAYEALAIPAPLEATCVYEPEGLTVSGALHTVLLAIDRETASMRILGYTYIEDSGLMINPDVVEGQSHGGITQGLSSFLMEGSLFRGWAANHKFFHGISHSNCQGSYEL